MHAALFSLGQFAFALDTLPMRELQQQLAWTHAENARVGAQPGVQFTGRQADKITITGATVPEIGSQSALDTITQMADAGATYTLADGTGRIYGAFVIEGVQLTKSAFIAEGVPRKIEFSITLKTGDPSQVDPAGGADDNAGDGWDGFDLWDWWLGL